MAEAFYSPFRIEDIVYYRQPDDPDAKFTDFKGRPTSVGRSGPPDGLVFDTDWDPVGTWDGATLREGVDRHHYLPSDIIGGALVFTGAGQMKHEIKKGRINIGAETYRTY
jgi:hypothetical protein